MARGDYGLAGETAETVARRSYGKLVAYLAARTRDVAGAEDALADAFTAALGEWPRSAVPANPEAWLLTVARRRMIDGARRRKTSQEAEDEIRRMADELAEAAAADKPIPDDRLALMFACAHPAIEEGIRAPLILQTLLGFDAATIASAFLVSPSTMGQRLVRAKSRIRQAGIPFRVPASEDLPERADAVLDALYATFGEGWSDPSGTDMARRNLTGECIWLARLVVSLLPDEPEALGLLALMLHAEARKTARRDEGGGFVPLGWQDTGLWNEAMIAEAETLLHRASALGRIGRYQLEAAVQSAHAARARIGHTDWVAIAKLYEALSGLTSSPVIAINRAVAVAESGSASAGLVMLDEVSNDPRLRDYQPYWAARADLLARSGHHDEAAEAYQRAIGIESDPAVRAFLQEKRAALCDR